MRQAKKRKPAKATAATNVVKHALATREKARRDHDHQEHHVVSELFSKFAQATSRITGKPVSFLVAVVVVIVWAATGPIFLYSDTWQLVINTGTTIVTFLMVFMIQNTQNRESMAVQLKLSELVLAMHGARNRMASIEDLSDEELEKLHIECEARSSATHEVLQKRKSKAKS
jgi:low affinity Fe/Cu permease